MHLKVSTVLQFDIDGYISVLQIAVGFNQTTIKLNINKNLVIVFFTCTRVLRALSNTFKCFCIVFQFSWIVCHHLRLVFHSRVRRGVHSTFTLPHQVSPIVSRSEQVGILDELINQTITMFKRSYEDGIERSRLTLNEEGTSKVRIFVQKKH